MSKRKLGVDLDSTLNNLAEVWLERYNKDYNDNLTQWDCWNVVECVKPECGKKILDYLHEKDFFLNLGVRDNAIDVLDYLSKYFEIYIVTAYSPDVCSDKAMWLKKHFPFIKQENIIFINDKSLLHLDFLIDDGPHNIEDFKYGLPIVYDMSYNEYLEDYNVFPRVKNWLEIKQWFRDEIEYQNKIDLLIQDVTQDN